ncbi:serine/threonine-protein phosphatase [Clostridium sp. MCC353]|uniref:PP2C family protein-serine/threonine phosphatase n=1 Tax=Clostridium sp. MCC353 TaxID=2592646 RepID=UPI001C030AD1|nr:protein phosphatase 2C domain-containing protein [Clostridium sp. MCC353]MBT9776428.1 serine/threonine-protein phosphatase [Clostridium sp. MCC353]
MEYSILTRTGSREINEDSVGVNCLDNRFCAVIADGLGGHDRGEAASALAVSHGLELFELAGNSGSWDLADYLTHCFEDSQNELLRMQKEMRSEMRTTLTVLAGADGWLQWGHIGDSRLYCFYEEKMVFRTLDHSVPQMLVKTGRIKESQIRGHDDRNKLLRVMGSPWDVPRYELSEKRKASEGEVFLLCTDGFWEWVEEKDMIKTLYESNSPKEWLEKMEQILLKQAEGKDLDNYSAAAVFLGEPKRKKRLLFGRRKK